MYDKDAVYVDLGGSHSHFSKVLKNLNSAQILFSSVSGMLRRLNSLLTLL